MNTKTFENSLRILWSRHLAVAPFHPGSPLQRLLDRGICYSSVKGASPLLVTATAPAVRRGETYAPDRVCGFNFRDEATSHSDPYYTRLANFLHGAVPGAFHDPATAGIPSAPDASAKPSSSGTPSAPDAANSSPSGNGIAFLDLFNFWKAPDESLLALADDDPTLAFLSDNLCLTQLLIEHVIRPRLIIATGRRSWHFWGKDAHPVPLLATPGTSPAHPGILPASPAPSPATSPFSVPSLDIWMGYRLLPVTLPTDLLAKHGNDSDPRDQYHIPEGNLCCITGLVDHPQRVSYPHLPDTALRGTFILFTADLASPVHPNAWRPTPALLAALHRLLCQ